MVWTGSLLRVPKAEVKVLAALGSFLEALRKYLLLSSLRLLAESNLSWF